MAYITDRHLNCTLSEQFLVNQGYTLQRHFSKSMWIGPGVVLYLDVNDVILNMYDLNKHIVDQSYANGRQMGKQDAINTIFNHLNQLVFPPQKINPTC